MQGTHLALGPILFFWTQQEVRDFYQRMASQPVETIYLGETVCSKRREMRLPDWIEVGQQLAEQGKRVVLSTLTLLEAESELKMLKRICANSDFVVEANDVAAIQLLSEHKLPFVVGPAINVYNLETLKLLMAQGMQRWVMPVELGRVTLHALLRQLQEEGLRQQLEVEVFAYGKLPLAYSARCFAARHLDLPKDNCQLCCLNYPDGLMVRSQEGKEVFTLNGIQTLSGDLYNLVEEVADLQQLGINALRLSPQLAGMEAVIQRFAAALEGQSSQQIPLLQASFCNGYWYGKPGLEWVDSA
ncbi:U32 family peptidase [Balneatrix alpica]|uniref:Ubiquinone biosynthesis protein UbiV n=1 Tax=Balneatrix alpica TaxID=75684 RepID=A0ABV5ZDK6_9GAMM|nr:U32 family peptidase [Balneatrix alpica]